MSFIVLRHQFKHTTTTMSAYTSGQVELNMSKFTWKIENFSKQCSNVKDLIWSPSFHQMRGSDWNLKLYPCGDTDSTEGFLSIYLFNYSEVEVNVCFEVILSDSNGIQLAWHKTHHNFLPNTSFGWPKFINRDSLLKKKDSLVDDILHITCIIHMDMYSEEEVAIDKKILNNYESLLSNEELSDLTFVINGKRIKAHKNILSARSRVFQAMFSHNMKENNTNTVKITDVSYNVMKELLLFIYSGKINDLKKNAKALLAAAEKYEINELKVLCEKYLWKNVKIDNSCDILIAADLYNCSKLKTKVTDYMISNIKTITNTAKFKNLNRTNPELFEEIMFAVVEKKL